MKKENQARQNGRHNSPGKQAQRTKSWTIRINLPSDLIELTDTVAKSEGMSRLTFITDAMHLMVDSILDKRQPKARPAPCPAQPERPAVSPIHGLMELDQEVHAAVGMMWLLSQSLAEYQSHLDMANIQSAAVGTLALADTASTRLRTAFDAAWDYYAALPDQAGAGAGSAQAGEGGAK